MVPTKFSLFVLCPSQGSFRLTQLLSSFPKVGRPCKSLHLSISSRRVASRHFRLPSLLTSKGTSISLCLCVPVAGKQHELHFPTPTPTHQAESFLVCSLRRQQQTTLGRHNFGHIFLHLPSFSVPPTSPPSINQSINELSQTTFIVNLFLQCVAPNQLDPSSPFSIPALRQEAFCLLLLLLLLHHWSGRPQSRRAIPSIPTGFSPYLPHLHPDTLAN